MDVVNYLLFLDGKIILIYLTSLKCHHKASVKKRKDLVIIQ